MRYALVLLVVTATATANAEELATRAKHDIVDVRKGRDPHRMHVLGWSLDGSVYVRIAVCSNAERYMGCTIRMERIDRFGVSHETELLDYYAFCEDGRSEQDCRWEVMSKQNADRLVAAERRYMRKLPPLEPGSQVADAKRVLGPDIELGATIEGTFIGAPEEGGSEAVRVKLHGRHGRKRRAMLAERIHEGAMLGDDFGLITRAWISPTRTRALVEVRFKGSMRPDIDAHHVEIVEARLAIP